eukprot:172567-Hanusia_phi.AAC.4
MSCNCDLISRTFFNDLTCSQSCETAGQGTASDLEEVRRAPVSPVVIRLPLLEDVEHRKVVALRHRKLLARCIALLCAIFRAIEDVTQTSDRQTSYDRQDFLIAPQLFCLDEHF